MLFHHKDRLVKRSTYYYYYFIINLKQVLECSLCIILLLNVFFFEIGAVL